MAEQMRPASKELAPDTARSYGRDNPDAESGMGRLDNDVATPTDAPDQSAQAVTNQQPNRQINAHDAQDGRAARDPSGGVAPKQPDHSMKDEEPLGWDQAPTGGADASAKRHPKPDGKGGTP